MDGMGTLLCQAAGGLGAGGNYLSDQALNAPCSGPLGPSRQADEKRGSRSRARQSAAVGGGAKRWLERDREVLFDPRAKKGGLGPDGKEVILS